MCTVRYVVNLSFYVAAAQSVSALPAAVGVPTRARTEVVAAFGAPSRNHVTPKTRAQQ